MPSYIVKRFNRYSLYYVGGQVPRDGMPQAAEIDCFEGDVRVGQLFFYNTSPIPDNSYAETVDVIFLNYQITQFNDVITILREESPLEIWFDRDNNAGYIATANYERVGEEERR